MYFFRIAVTVGSDIMSDPWGQVRSLFSSHSGHSVPIAADRRTQMWTGTAGQFPNARVGPAFRKQLERDSHAGTVDRRFC